MSNGRPVSGAFEAYRAEKAASRARHPARAGVGRPRTTTGRSSTAPRRPHRTLGGDLSSGARHVGARLLAPPAVRSTGPSLRVVRRRLGGLRVAAVVLLLVVIGKLLLVQVVDPDRFLAKGVEQRLATYPVTAGRGSIVDRNGVVLAPSVPRRTVFADPELIRDPEATARRLAPILGIDRRTLTDQMSGDGRFVVLAHTLDDDVADAVEALDLVGISTFEEFKRIQPAGDLARSLLGRVAIDGSAGISGLELQYDGRLTGTPGSVTYERSMVDGGGAITGTRSSTAARPGAEVALTLDQTLQYEAERSLADHLARSGALGGTAIVTRPSTGEILALATLAVDDDGGYVPTSNNVALTTMFDPGSVNKIITVAAAIEEGLVTPDTVLEVPDHLQVGDHLFTDAHEHATTAWTVTDILASSSNVGTIMLAQELGYERMDEYLRRFGFGELTGLGFPNETAGDMLTLEQWAQESTSLGSIPIGQGISVTGVQMVQALNVLANDGLLVAPRLVQSIDGEVLPAAAPVRVVSPETARAVRAMMAQVVERGTGQQAQVPGYSVAGKTGTARKPQPGGGYEDEDGRMHYIATFAGTLPAENPDLSVVVIVDEPDPGRSIYAADVAAPAFAELARITLRHLQIPPSAGGDVSDVPELSDSAAAVQDSYVPASPRTETGRSEDDTIPNGVG